MKTLIKCSTLFDITNTGVSNRKPPMDLEESARDKWILNRNRQNNFDTLIQVISLRTQPEEISFSTKKEVDFKTSDKFGFLFENEDSQPYWEFTFVIYYNNAYNDGIDDFGSLYADCDGVPMLKIGSEWEKLPNFLDTSPELRNIYFEVLSNE